MAQRESFSRMTVFFDVLYASEARIRHTVLAQSRLPMCSTQIVSC